MAFVLVIWHSCVNKMYILNHIFRLCCLVLLSIQIFQNFADSLTFSLPKLPFGLDQLMEKFSTLSGSKRDPSLLFKLGKLKTRTAYWSGNEVPYVFHISCQQGCREKVEEALSEWEKDTCIRFVDWGDASFENDDLKRNYIKFRADQPGCFTVTRNVQSSMIFGQSVNLGKGCLKKLKILHELGHVLGLDHVHGRADRDLYIEIKMENVLKGFEDQYEIRQNLTELVPYDYRSIMHYDSSDFSASPFEKITMSTRIPTLQYLIDEPRNGLSFYDLKQVNKMYNCTTACSGMECLNEGIPIQRNGTTCQCLCPPAYMGNHCEIAMYKHHSNPLITRSGKIACGGILKSEGSISTRDYPRRTRPYDSCGWIINAPLGQRIEIFFEDFWFEEPTVYLDHYPNRCVSERVEVRCNGVYEPEMYCGRQLNNSVIKSRSNYLVINVIAGPTKVGRGLKARFKFIT